MKYDYILSGKKSLTGYFFKGKILSQVNPYYNYMNEGECCL